MLRAVFGFTWRDRITNEDLYGELSKITAVLKARRLRSIGGYMEEKRRAGMSTTDSGTKTGNKEKTKASNYIFGPVKKWHWFVNRRTKKHDGRPSNRKILVDAVWASSRLNNYHYIR